MDPYAQRGMIVLYNDADPVGALIRIGSGSGWTHVAMCLGDGNAIQCDARMGGVCIEPAFQQRNPRPIGVYPGDVEHAIAWYEQRLAAKDRYDYVGLVASLLWRFFRVRMALHAGSWNCATFLACPMVNDAHGPQLPAKPLAAFTPADFLGLFPS